MLSAAAKCFLRKEENSDVIVYIEQKEENRVEISAKELAEVVLPRLKEWIVEINTACDPIVRNGKTRYVLTGKEATFLY